MCTFGVRDGQPAAPDASTPVGPSTYDRKRFADHTQVTPFNWPLRIPFCAQWLQGLATDPHKGLCQGPTCANQIVSSPKSTKVPPLKGPMYSKCGSAESLAAKYPPPLYAR